MPLILILFLVLPLVGVALASLAWHHWNPGPRARAAVIALTAVLVVALVADSRGLLLGVGAGACLALFASTVELARRRSSAGPGSPHS